MKIIIFCVVGTLLLLWIGGFLNIWFGLFDSFYHDILYWHDGKGGDHSFDGCSMHSTCSKCGKSVMLDSQGNWF